MNEVALVSRRRRHTPAQWSRLFSQFWASGLSVSAFCQRVGVSEASFYRWRAQLAGPNPAGRSDQGVARRVRGNHQRFVDLGSLVKSAVVTPAPNRISADTERVSVRIELGVGVVLQISRA